MKFIGKACNDDRLMRRLIRDLFGSLGMPGEIRGLGADAFVMGFVVLLLILIAIAWVPPVRPAQTETVTPHSVPVTTVPLHSQNMTVIPWPEGGPQVSVTNVVSTLSNESSIEKRRVWRNPVADELRAFIDLLNHAIAQIISFFTSGLAVGGNASAVGREGGGNPFIILPLLGCSAGILAYMIYSSRKRKLRIALRYPVAGGAEAPSTPGTPSLEPEPDPLTKVVIKLATMASDMLGMDPSVITHRESLIVSKEISEATLKDKVNEVVTLYEQRKFAGKEVGRKAYELAEKILEKLEGGGEA